MDHLAKLGPDNMGCNCKSGQDLGSVPRGRHNPRSRASRAVSTSRSGRSRWHESPRARARARVSTATVAVDRKSTRLNSSHGYISYAVFCLKKKKRMVVVIG